MINYDLNKIKAIIFDVDGVLSAETVLLYSDGEPMRTINIKDGYAIQLAQKMGLKIVLLTGATTESVRLRYERLGVKDIYMRCAVKIQTYDAFLEKYEVMKRCGCPCCPADACPEIKSVSKYISHKNGGYGCARDIIEQVLRVQGKWMSDAHAFGW